MSGMRTCSVVESVATPAGLEPATSPLEVAESGTLEALSYPRYPIYSRQLRRMLPSPYLACPRLTRFADGSRAPPSMVRSVLAAIARPFASVKRSMEIVQNTELLVSEDTPSAKIPEQNPLDQRGFGTTITPKISVFFITFSRGRSHTNSRLPAGALYPRWVMFVASLQCVTVASAGG